MEKENIYAIKVTNLKKAYQDKLVLNGVHFQVKKGTIFCLLGSNGAGKTTTVKILSTLITQDEGQASVCQYDVKKEAAMVRKSISLTGQYAAVDEILTGFENMEMVARLCHVFNPKKHAMQLLRDFQLEDAKDRRVSTYSGGMRRRLDIAMSLTGHPSVIFLDEPTTGLDPQSRNSMWRMIKELKESGVTIFLTTQYLEEAEQLADHVAILHDGVIIADGSVDQIKELSSSEYITFSFQESKDMEKMLDIFSDQMITSDSDALNVTLEITDGITQVTNILTLMKTHNLAPTSFNQKKASLEDVFLNLVDKKGETYV